MKVRIIERTSPSGRVQYVIQQKHSLFRWWWVDAWINSACGASCQDSFDSFEEAKKNLCFFDGTKCKENNELKYSLVQTQAENDRLTAENKNCRTMLNDNRERARLLQEEITERDKQNRRLTAKNKELLADVAEFNQGWTDAQSKLPFDDEKSDIWQQGWQVFDYGRLISDLKKHGGHTIKCNFDAMLEGGAPKCTCGVVGNRAGPQEERR